MLLFILFNTSWPNSCKTNDLPTGFGCTFFYANKQMLFRAVHMCTVSQSLVITLTFQIWYHCVFTETETHSNFRGSASKQLEVALLYTTCQYNIFVCKEHRQNMSEIWHGLAVFSASSLYAKQGWYPSKQTWDTLTHCKSGCSLVIAGRGNSFLQRCMLTPG